MRTGRSLVPGGEGKPNEGLSVIESLLDVARHTILAEMSTQGLDQCKPGLETLNSIGLREVGRSNPIKVSNLGLDLTDKNVPMLALVEIREGDGHVVLGKISTTRVLELDGVRGGTGFFKARRDVGKMK